LATPWEMAQWNRLHRLTRRHHPLPLGIGSGLGALANRRSRKQPLADFGSCLGLSDICPLRETEAAREAGLRAGVG